VIKRYFSLASFLFVTITPNVASSDESLDFHRYFDKEPDLRKWEMELIRKQGIEYDGVTFDLQKFDYLPDYEKDKYILLMIKTLCPYCSTVEEGSNVRVSYSKKNKSSEKKEQKKVNEDDNHHAEDVAYNCRDLIEDENTDKDIVILDRNGEREIAICFQRD